MTCRRPQKSLNRRGFTLIEMLVVIGIIVILAAISLPALTMARESARSASCSRNLHNFGIGIQAFANRQQEKLCTGAFDWKEDGAVTEFGWVADLVGSGVPVGKMLCPSNPATIADTYVDLLQADPASIDNSCSVNRLGGTATTAPDGSMLTNPCREIVDNSMAAGSEPRRLLLEKRVFNQFYNTNYTASWFFVRGDVLIDEPTGNIRTMNPAPCSADIKSRNTTRGPLRRVITDTAKASSSLIPLLADGKPSSRTLPVQIGNLPIGTVTVAAMTRGPVLKEDVSGAGTALQVPTISGPKSTWFPVWNDKVLQDYTNFNPLHRGGCNVLFADGSVRTLNDKNRDGVLNNGFGAVGEFSTAEPDVGETDIFSLFSTDAVQR